MQPPQPPLVRAEEAKLLELREKFGDPVSLQPGQHVDWEVDFPLYFLQHVKFRAERDHGLVLSWKIVKPRYWTYQAKKIVRIKCRGRWSKAS